MQGQIQYYFRTFISRFISARCGGLEEDNGNEVWESMITDMDITAVFSIHAFQAARHFFAQNA